MSLPNFVGSAHDTVNGTSKEVTYPSTTGNLLLVAVALNDGSSSVSGITDSAGNDSDSNPINNWALISANTFNGTRLEVWGCRAAVAIANLTVVLAATQEMTILVAEYTGNTFLDAIQAQVSRGQNPTVSEDITLYFSEPAPNSSSILVGFFSLLGDSVHAASIGTVQNAPAGGTIRANLAESSPLVSLALLDQSTSDVSGDGQFSVGVYTNTLAESTPTDNVAASSLQGIAIIISSGLTFTAIPGFSDVADSVFLAEQDAIGANIAKIADNAAFGMVRLETFFGTYKNGDTIPLPVSTVDGYNYSRDELTYIWGIYTSANPATGWLTGPDSLWYGAWLVDQTSGLVSTVEWYRRSGAHANPAQSNDGVLAVTTVAQRRNNQLTMASQAAFAQTDPTIYVQDAPLSQSMLTDVSHNAKFSVVNTEVIYMGEFTAGEVVPAPVSPADGYVYQYYECKFAFSWRWTTLGSSFTQPDMSLGQMGPMQATVGATGTVNVLVEYIDDSGSLSSQTTHGRVAVFAICQRFSNSFATGPNQSVSIHCSGVPSHDTFTFSSFPDLSNGYMQISYPSGDMLDDQLYYWYNAAGKLLRVDTITHAEMAVAGLVTIACPFGAHKMELHTTDPGFDMSAVFVSIVQLYTFTLESDFAEIDLADFMPGNPLPASIMKTIDRNAQQAAFSPEVFGQYFLSNGETVPLPVSANDGYKYSRSELSYLWEWADTTNQTGSNLRLPVFFGTVDQSSGLVTLNCYRLPPGGPVVDDGRSFASISVIVIANRQAQQPAVAAISANPPSDISSIAADLSDGSEDTINGV